MKTFTLLTAQGLLAKRIHPEALLHYAKAVERTLDDLDVEHPALSRCDLQAAIALLPGDRVLIELQFHPQRAAEGVRDRVRERLEGLARPPVTGAPVAFVATRVAENFRSTERITFPPPFAAMLSGRPGPVEPLLMRAAGLSPTSDSASDDPSIRRLRRWPRSAIRWLVRRICGLGRGGGVAAAADVPADVQGEGRSVEGEGQATAAGVPPHREAARGDSVARLRRPVGRRPDRMENDRLRAVENRSQGRFDGVIADCDRLLRTDPGDLEALWMRAEAHCVTGCRQQGLRDVTAILLRDPQHPRALHLRGMIYMDLEAWTRAAADLGLCSSIDPSNPTLRLRHAQALLGCEDWQGALRGLDAVLAADPYHAPARLLRALVRRRALPELADPDGEIGLILADLDAAIWIEPDEAQYRLQRAAMRLVGKDYAGVLVDCGEAIRLKSPNGPALALRGIARQSLGDANGAVEDCTAAEAQGSASCEVYLARAAAYDSLGQPESALRDCDAALHRDPSSATAYDARGLLHLKLHDWERAEEDFTLAIDCSTDWSLPFVHRSTARRLLGNCREALVDLDRAGELGASGGDLCLARGLAHVGLERWEEAMNDLDLALAHDRDLASAYFVRSLVRLQQRDYPRALADLDETLRADAGHVPALFNRANLLVHLGRFDDALSDLDRLVELCPDLGAAWSARGTAKIQRGDCEGGRQDFRQAITCEPAATDQYRVQQLLVEATWFHRCEEYARAVVSATTALEIDGQCAPAFAVRATAYWYAEQLVEALDDFDWLIEHGGNAFPTHLARGQVLAEQGEFKAALADLNRAITLHAGQSPSPELGYAYAARGLARAGLGNLDEADRDFELASPLCPGNAWLHYNRGLRYDRAGDRSKAAACFQLALRSDDPPLTPRKRSRAAGYIQRFGETQSDPS